MYYAWHYIMRHATRTVHDTLCRHTYRGTWCTVSPPCLHYTTPAQRCRSHPQRSGARHTAPLLPCHHALSHPNRLIGTFCGVLARRCVGGTRPQMPDCCYKEGFPKSVPVEFAEKASQSKYIKFIKMAQHLDLAFDMCFCYRIPAPLVPGVPTKTRLESS